MPTTDVSLTFRGHGRDFISGSGAWSESTPATSFSGTVSPDLNYLRVAETSAPSWGVTLTAPPGQSLTAGATYLATRPVAGARVAGFELSGNGHSCSVSISRFTVDVLDVGPVGAITSLAVSFEQHCENETSFAAGTLRVGTAAQVPLPVTTAPAPLPLSIVALTLSGTAGEYISGGTAWVVSDFMTTGSTFASHDMINGENLGWTPHIITP